MKKFLLISALLSAGAVAPGLAQDQGDPNPPTLQRPATPGTPAKLKEAQATTSRPTTTPTAGDTSGPAAGTSVDPSTAVQKRNPRMQAVNPNVSGPSSAAAGAPGVEGKRGTQAGKEWIPPREIREKNVRS